MNRMIRLSSRLRSISTRIRFIILSLILICTLFYYNITQQSYDTKSQLHTSSRDDGFAACLVLKDDNDRLSEWLAYHWLVLPLKYLVVAIDPTGTTSPQKILQIWNTSDMDMEIILWNDVDYGHYINWENDEKHRHRDRQKRMLAECEKYHKDRNRTWLAVIDPDEFITYNTVAINDPPLSFVDKTPHQYTLPTYHRKMMEWRWQIPDAIAQHTTIFDFINHRKHEDPWLSEPCHLMPRLFFGSEETSPFLLQHSGVEQYGFNTLQFSTLRFFHHADKGEFEFNHYGKVIMDLSRLNREDMIEDMYSIHRPIEPQCLKPLKAYADGIFRVHHYLGTWEQYAAKSDVRRSRSVFDWKSSPNGGVDFQLQSWLKRFIEVVGVEKSKKLLQHAGMIDVGSIPIINTTDYVVVPNPYYEEED